MLPPLISVILSLALLGFLLWVVITYIPMPEPFKRVILVVVLVIVIIWLLRYLGVFA